MENPFKIDDRVRYNYKNSGRHGTILAIFHRYCWVIFDNTGMVPVTEHHIRLEKIIE